MGDTGCSKLQAVVVTVRDIARFLLRLMAPVLQATGMRGSGRMVRSMAQVRQWQLMGRLSTVLGRTASVMVKE